MPVKKLMLKFIIFNPIYGIDTLPNELIYYILKEEAIKPAYDVIVKFYEAYQEFIDICF